MRNITLYSSKEGWKPPRQPKTRKFPVPGWAQMLIESVCASWDVPQPVVRWSINNSRFHTSGRAYSHEFTGQRNTKAQLLIVQGTDHEDAKLVLLHELTHWVLPHGEHHGSYFWKTAFEMYTDYDIRMDYAAEREGRYRKEAQRAAARLRHPA